VHWPDAGPRGPGGDRPWTGTARREPTEETAMLYVLMWLLGVPLGVIVLLFLLGIGR
jgi:hypothetical protein